MILALAMAFASWSAWSYVDARHDGPLAFEQERDQVLAAATSEIAVLNSIDASQVDSGLRAWQDAATGPLRDSLRQAESGNRQNLQQQRVSSAATVQQVAVIQLDRRAGSAQVIASISLTRKPQAGPASTARNRFHAALQRTGEGWKVRTLTAIPAGEGHKG
ncbi:hypothetical protein D5S17_33575 [Pseudonocardiaceae bacterium YIM PH 21723]|nr:hypothetical protein D5S17_33575 [Pseudonocardiaceae bacterium YIM PH 21723]